MEDVIYDGERRYVVELAEPPEERTAERGELEVATGESVDEKLDEVQAKLDTIIELLGVPR